MGPQCNQATRSSLDRGPASDSDPALGVQREICWVERSRHPVLARGEPLLGELVGKEPRPEPGIVGGQSRAALIRCASSDAIDSLEFAGPRAPDWSRSAHGRRRSGRTRHPGSAARHVGRSGLVDRWSSGRTRQAARLWRTSRRWARSCRRTRTTRVSGSARLHQQVAPPPPPQRQQASRNGIRLRRWASSTRTWSSSMTRAVSRSAYGTL